MINMTDGLSSDASCSRNVFKFDDLYRDIFLLSFLLLISVLFNIREMVYGYYAGALVMLAISATLGALIYTYMLVGADIVVDDRSLSRVIFGKIIQTIEWSDIDLIRISNGFGRSKYSYNIYSAKIKHRRLGVNGKLAFGDDMANSDEFITLMNSHIAMYRIKIESIVGGSMTFPARLPESKKVRPGKIDLSKFD